MARDYTVKRLLYQHIKNCEFFTIKTRTNLAKLRHILRRNRLRKLNYRFAYLFFGRFLIVAITHNVSFIWQARLVTIELQFDSTPINLNRHNGRWFRYDDDALMARLLARYSVGVVSRYLRK